MGRPPETIDTDLFIAVWERCHTLEEVHQEVTRLCKESGRRPLSKASLATKASNLRAKGYDLSLKKGPRKADVAEANRLIAEVRAAKQREEAAKKAAAQAAVQRLLARYQAQRGE